MKMEMRMTFNGFRYYMQYTVTLHGTIVLEDILMPGDLMSVMDKFNDDQKTKIVKRIERRR
jgi:hypothetical protein